jgi:limonene-1,2-epoxide hydrolase
MSGFRLVLMTLTAPLLAVAWAAKAGAAEPSSQAQILQIEENMANVPTAAEALKYFDPDIVLDDLTPGRVRGIKNVGTLIKAQFAAIKDVKVQILSISIDADSRLAYAYSLQKISMTYVQSNQPIGTVYRQVDCYHRVGGKWLIVYQQLSAPFDPVTGKAVLNAGP